MIFSELFLTWEKILFVQAEQIVEEVVSMEQWKDKRASKLDLDDFLALLAEFNKRGIHFA